MRTLVIMALGSILAAPSFAYTVVRKDGTKFQTESAPTYKDGQASFTLAGGSKGSVPESGIDKAATAKANPAPDAKGTQAPKKEGAAVFTNEDLKNAKGLSDSDGKVEVEGAPDTSSADADADFAARHDREMAERAKGDAGSSEETRIKELEADVARLEKELADTDPNYVYTKGGRTVDHGTVVARHKQVAEELTAARQALAEARGEE